MKLHRGIQRHLQMGIVPHVRFFSIYPGNDGMIGFGRRNTRDNGIETSVTSFRLRPKIQAPPIKSEVRHEYIAQVSWADAEPSRCFLRRIDTGRCGPWPVLEGIGCGGGSTTAPQGNASAANPEGFAIESEMLTYTAMDSEGAAVACGIGRNVGAADTNCAPQPITGPPVGVVVVSGESSALNEFQLWRTDISTMDMLTLRARHYCPQGPEGRAATSPTLLGTLTSMFPESQAASFAMSLLSATAEASPLEGNILDRTLVNDVAGHLRALGLDVVIPDHYMPYSLTAIDANRSPFLTKYVELIKVRACVAPTAPENQEGAATGAEPAPPGDRAANAQVEADKKAIGQAIDAFLKSLTDPMFLTCPSHRQARLLLRKRRSFLI